MTTATIRTATDGTFTTSDRIAARRLYALFRAYGWTHTLRGWINPERTAIVEWGDDPRPVLIVHDPADTSLPPVHDRIHPVDNVAQAVGILVVLQLIPGMVSTQVLPDTL